MSVQMLSRHVASLRKTVASPTQIFRSSSSTFLHGIHILSLDSLVTGKATLNLPLKWIAAASYKQRVGTAYPENPTPKQRPSPNNPWKGSKAGQGNVVVVPLKKRSVDGSKVRKCPPFLLSKSTQALNPSFHSRMHSNQTASKLSRALHSAVGDDDESDADFDDFLIDKDTLKGEERSSTSPVVATRKRKASAIDACEDSEEEEEQGEGRFDREMRKSAPTSRMKPWRSDSSKNINESRVTSVKKRSVVLEGALDSESVEAGKKLDTSHELELDEKARPLDQESSPPKGETKPITDYSAEKDTESTPSHLTNTRFDKFPISPLSIKALHSVFKYERMTEVQEATFPVILKGQDVLAKARTGTGKTIAFLLPAIEAILQASEGKSKNPIHVVIVCPTRELAQQAAAEAQTLLQFHRGLGAQVVYGGNSIRGEQINLSRKPCQILVGTPGRLVDHIQRTPELERQLKSVKLFVLDEADHMLDMGFRDSLHKIMEALPSKRQTLLFSATIPKEVHNISKVALKNDHVFIDAVGKNSQDTHAKVKQQYIMVPLEKQLRVLYAALKQHMEEDPNYKVLVFCTTARGTGFLCKLFLNLGFNAREIHSRKDQNYRTRVSDEFRKSKGGIILFTSDVSARGVDYPNVTLVVQVGAPSEMEQYIHRLGRTGRAGKKGEGLLILAPWEEYFLQKLSNLPIMQLPAPKLTASAKQKILASAATVDEGIKEMAYTAWLGYYRSLKGLTLEKVLLVEYANQYSYSMGYDEPPPLSKMVASKMALAGVPGLRIRRYAMQNFLQKKRFVGELRSGKS